MIVSVNGNTNITGVDYRGMMADLGVIVISVLKAMETEFGMTESEAFDAVVKLVTITTPEVLKETGRSIGKETDDLN